MPLHLLRDRQTQTANAFPDLFRRGMREVQPQVAAAFNPARIEAIAGYESDVLAQRRFALAAHTRGHDKQ